MDGLVILYGTVPQEVFQDPERNLFPILEQVQEDCREGS